MISITDYFGKWMDEGTEEHMHNALILLDRVNKLLFFLMGKGMTFPYNNKTGSLISGTQYGGFRPQSCPEGAPHSAHKTGEAIDIYDPNNSLDLAIYNDSKLLAVYDLYIEHPDATIGWCHLATRAPKSGKRIFFP